MGDETERGSGAIQYIAARESERIDQVLQDLGQSEVTKVD
jgi:hypothetical protein